MYLALVATILLAPGYDAWTSNGPLGGFLQCVEYNSNGYLYVGVRGCGVYRKQRFSGPWQPANRGIEPVSILTLRSLGRDTLFGGMEDYGLVRTFDGGLNWYTHPDIPTTSVSDILAFTVTRAVMLLATNAGTYVSTNRGTNWIRTDTITRVSCVATPRDTIAFCGTDNRGIYYSTNWGVNWRPIPAQPDNQINDIDFAAKAGTVYFFAGTERGLFFSTDYGVTWRNTVLVNTGISRIDFATDTIYVSTFGGGIWRSTIDNPTGYTQLRNGLACLVATDMFTPSSNELYATTSGGFFYGYTETSPTWLEDLAGLNAQSIQDIDVMPGGRLFASTLGGGLYTSSNNGGIWQRTPTTPQIPLFLCSAVDPNNAQNIICGTLFSLVYHTTDGGQNWNYFIIDTIAPPGSIYSLAIDSVRPQNVLAGTDSGVYRSTNGGRAWAPIAGIIRGTRVFEVSIDPINPQNVYAATALRIFKSTDGGRNFGPASGGIPVGLETYRVRTDRTAPLLLYTSFSFNSGGMYRSVTGGLVWSNTQVRDSVTAIASGGLPYQVLFGTTNRGMFLSPDSLHTITPFNHGLSSPRIICAEMASLANRSAYAGTPNGVFVYTDTTRPVAQIAWSPDSVFSPDGDSIDDFINFSLSYADSGRCSQWFTRIRKDTTVLASQLGIGNPPPSVTWDGFDTNGRKAVNGYYQAVFGVVDNFGNTDSVIRFCQADARPMVSAQPLATMGSNGRKVIRDRSGSIHVVYAAYHPLVPIPGEVFCAFSTNNGQVWSEPADLSNSRSRISGTPALTVDVNDTIHVVWQEFYALRNCVFYQRGRNNQWLASPEIVVDSNAGPPAVIADQAGNIHLVWENRALGGSREIYYRMRQNGGPWGSISNLSNNTTGSTGPTIVSYRGDSLCVAWSDSVPGSTNQIFCRHGRANAGWGPALQITSTSAKALTPSLVADPGNNLHLVWTDSINAATSYLLYRRYNYFSGWDTLVAGVSDSTHKTELPSIAADASENIYVVWEENDTRVLLRSFDHQLGWQARTTFSDSSTSAHPSISPTGHAIWTERSAAPYNVRYKSVNTISDLTPPRLVISARDTISLGDTLTVYVVSDELLREAPAVRILGPRGESLIVVMLEDTTTTSPYDYEGAVVIRGLALGSGRIAASAADLANNTGSAERPLLVRTQGGFLPPDSVFAFPNPTRRDYINFMFYINQNATVQIEVFTISGRRVAQIPASPGRYDGGMFHQERFSLGRLGTDVYIFRLKAEAVDSSDEGTVIKKFGVIR